MSWNKLNIQQRGELMKLYLQHGIKSLSEMRDHYNSVSGHVGAYGMNLDGDGKKKMRQNIETWGKTNDESNEESVISKIGSFFNMKNKHLPTLDDIGEGIAEWDITRRFNTYFDNLNNEYSLSKYNWDEVTRNRKLYPLYTKGQIVNHPIYGRILIQDVIKDSGATLERPSYSKKNPTNLGFGLYSRFFNNGLNNKKFHYNTQGAFIDDLYRGVLENAYNQYKQKYMNLYNQYLGYGDLNSPAAKAFKKTTLDRFKGGIYNGYLNPNYSQAYRFSFLDQPEDAKELKRSAIFQAEQEAKRAEHERRLAKEQAEIDAALKPQQEAYARAVALSQQFEKEQREEAELYEKRVRLLEKIDAFREQGYDVTERYDDFGNIVGFTRSKEPKKQTKSTYKPTTYKASSDNIFKYPNNSNVHSDATGYEKVEVLEDGTLKWLSQDVANNGKRITYHTDRNYKLLDYSYANGGHLFFDGGPDGNLTDEAITQTLTTLKGWELFDGAKQEFNKNKR